MCCIFSSTKKEGGDSLMWLHKVDLMVFEFTFKHNLRKTMKFLQQLMMSNAQGRLLSSRSR